MRKCEDFIENVSAIPQSDNLMSFLRQMGALQLLCFCYC